ncbi:hypothetical protein FKP32DRAFT_1168580 [Trametes sanguinea]|nr:hypothetical protein FKP32DRAFT_1168580 [Trametes sanguinea]
MFPGLDTSRPRTSLYAQTGPSTFGWLHARTATVRTGRARLSTSGAHEPALVEPNSASLLRMAQITFRINPKPTYSERMTEARSELRRLIKEQLCSITHDSTATMSWSRRAYIKNVVTRYRVRIEGWPLSEVPFVNLSDVPNLGKLELLLQGWKDGTIRFRQINEEQYLAMLHDPTPWIGPATGAVDPEGDD